MKNLLIVVDMQKGFARYEQTIKLTEKIRNLLESKSFDAVIATKFLNNRLSLMDMNNTSTISAKKMFTLA